MRNLRSSLLLLLLPLLPAAATGCLNGPAGQINVPSDVVRGPAYGPEGQPPRSRYVVRMTDGDQDWELQLPEIATAYEVRIPLRGRPGLPGGAGGAELASVTAADKEIARAHEAEENARADSQVGDEGDEEGKKATRAVRQLGPTPSPRSSYLLTLAKVKELYKTRNYEVALVELTSLERDYPNDERILSMKGSLYEKLGKKQLARDTWQTVLSINPYNLQVVEALQRLGK